MYKPHRCLIEHKAGGFDEFRNPISAEESSIAVESCFLDQNLPNTPVFSPDGQKVQDASGVIFFSKDDLNLSDLKIGDSISVFDKETEFTLFKGEIKSFSLDLFHIRVWV